MQGHLRKSHLVVEISSACAQCDQPLVIVVDSELDYQVRQGGAHPLVFEPDVDWSTFTEPTIVDAYCRKNLFFCSEDHARDHRSSVDQADGSYLSLDQSCFSTRVAQAALFAF